jgi:hypothetical protein
MLNIIFWLDILRSLSPYFPTIVYLTGLSGYGGLTVPLSLIWDVFSALTLHVSLSHLMLKNALSYQISALRSLFNLFRGTVENQPFTRLAHTDYRNRETVQCSASAYRLMAL